MVVISHLLLRALIGNKGCPSLLERGQGGEAKKKAAPKGAAHITKFY